MDDLPHEPVVLVREQRVVHGQDGGGIPDGLDDDRADQRLVQAQPQQRVVQLAERTERPVLVACRDDRFGRRRLLTVRAR